MKRFLASTVVGAVFAVMGLVDIPMAVANSGYTKRTGDGVRRAKARIAAHIAQQRERLKDAPAQAITRQQVRSFAIRGR